MKKLVLVLLFVANYATMLAQNPKLVISDKEGWHKIGETVVDFRNETDQILVVGANRFASIKIVVTDAPINLVSFDIYFDKGKHRIVPIGEEIRIPGESKTVFLNGEENVRRVSFRYNSLGDFKGKKGHVELWGLKTNVDKKTP
ncbi:hypothetical protein [Flavobacterium sp.]|uniref:hypothetical protein n=1 Tax=Flavobacterium sp. TaxID=239 RepID=UPI00260BC405|nr:hypothetical protein [Flavobacterium sp.]